MDRYHRVEKPRPEEPINENEIRITAQGLIRNYISYATSLLQDKQEKEVILKAMGQAISKAVTIAEIIKKRVPGLYQDISTSSTTITDAYEPIEEGLTPLEMKRQVSLITITLSTVELNSDSPGFQAPPDAENVGIENQQEYQPAETNMSTYVNQDSYAWRGRGRGRGGGRGRGRGRGRGYGRGGYGNYQGYYQENDGYYNWGRGGRRGRGWGYRGAGYGGGGGRGRGRIRGGGGRAYGQGRGRMGGRARGGGYQA